MRILTKIPFLWLPIALLYSLNAFGRSAIDVYSQEEKKIPLFMEDFHCTQDTELESVAESTLSIIINDLNNGGYIEAKSTKDLSIWHSLSEDKAEKFLQVKKWGYDNLISGSIALRKNGEYVFKFQLWDVYSENIVIEKTYAIRKPTLRQVAHAMADEIMFHITGRKGFFQSKIVYVDERRDRRKNNMQKYIAIMDQDGYNHRILSSDKIAIKPSFASSEKKIIYTGFTALQPKTRIIDLKTSQVTDLSKAYPILRGKSIISPRMSPDGSSIMMSILEEKSTNIYKLERATGKLTKLTQRGINVSASFSPDGKYLVFSSDMSGSLSLYIMDTDGYHMQRVNMHNGNYNEPAFSPNGQWIAFTKIANGDFHIGIMRLDGRDERILGSHYLAAGATWSPNGRELAFSFANRKKKENKIKIVSVTTGRVLRILETPAGASDPVWVPVGR